MLDLKTVDLEDLAQALEDHSYDQSWWLDPQSEIVLWSDYAEEQGEIDPERQGLRPIDPVPSHEGYADMQGNRLGRVLLFGSWARGGAHPESDIDLLAALDPSTRSGTSSGEWTQSSGATRLKMTPS